MAITVGTMANISIVSSNQFCKPTNITGPTAEVVIDTWQPELLYFIQVNENKPIWNEIDLAEIETPCKEINS